MVILENVGGAHDHTRLTWYITRMYNLIRNKNIDMVISKMV